MKLEEILFNTVCQIPKYPPTASAKEIKEDAETIEGFTYSGFMYDKTICHKISSLSRNKG